MKPTADRINYLSRVIARRLKESMNLVQKADDETVRRAVVRGLPDSFRELDAIEQKRQESLAKRRSIAPRDQEFLYARSLEEELRKHGA